jgi:hypothetical protein
LLTLLESNVNGLSISEAERRLQEHNLQNHKQPPFVNALLLRLNKKSKHINPPPLLSLTIIFIATSVFVVCPFYSLFGFSTYSAKKA